MMTIDQMYEVLKWADENFARHSNSDECYLPAATLDEYKKLIAKHN